VGLPAAGTQVRLVPVGDKLELRVKGPCVTPGYWRAPRLTAEAFDEQGYFRTGDAVALANGENLSQGLRFDGRLAEDFKLSTGTTVSVGPLRASLLLALAPLVQDVVLAGLNRNDVGLLVFPDARGCATVLAGLAASATLPELAACQPLRAEIALRLRRHALAAGGSASRVARALLLATPPSLAGGELGGKGTINQRAALACRASEITELYAAPPAAHVILVATE
jgi:feruloyl-CoA synthase